MTQRKTDYPKIPLWYFPWEKNGSHLGSSTQELKINPRQDTYFRKFLKEMELFRVKQRWKISGFRSRLIQQLLHQNIWNCCLQLCIKQRMKFPQKHNHHGCTLEVNISVLYIRSVENTFPPFLSCRQKVRRFASIVFSAVLCTVDLVTVNSNKLFPFFSMSPIINSPFLTAT